MTTTLHSGIKHVGINGSVEQAHRRRIFPGQCADSIDTALRPPIMNTGASFTCRRISAAYHERNRFCQSRTTPIRRGLHSTYKAVLNKTQRALLK